MPKMKTNKAAKKRIRVTATGKIRFARCGKRHLNAGKTGKRKRHLRGSGIIDGKVAQKYVILINGGA